LQRLQRCAAVRILTTSRCVDRTNVTFVKRPSSGEWVPLAASLMLTPFRRAHSFRHALHETFDQNNGIL
jgi:hypothetical protein